MRRIKPEPLLPAPWGACMMDCPWNETGGQGPSWGMTKRGADRLYDLVKTRDMPGLVLRSGLWTPADDAHLYMWATNNFLLDAAWVMSELGFRYVTKVTWPKEDRVPWLCCPYCQQLTRLPPDDRGRCLNCHRGKLEAVYVTKAKRKFGLGKYFRGADECILFGVRGRGLARNTPNNSLTTLLYGRLREHSRKPEEAYDLVEARSRGPFLDMFSSEARLRGPARPGWAHWGRPRGAPAPILNVASSYAHGQATQQETPSAAQ